MRGTDVCPTAFERTGPTPTRDPCRARGAATFKRVVDAALYLARIGTRVVVKCIAVIAGLHPGPNHAVSAARCSTAAQAGIGVHIVTVVALFNPGLDETITASSELTARATVALVGVCVVALLYALPDQPVAAKGIATLNGTTVAVI